MSDNGNAPKQTYTRGNQVFAKMKGYPYWPAQIIERLPGKEEKYLLIFYGSHDTAQIKAAQITPYNETTLAKHGKPSKPQASFLAALEEVASNMDLLEIAAQPDPTEPIAPPVENEGDLQIDEGPPLLTKEAFVPEPAKEVASVKPPPPAARRLSKSQKRDSLSSINVPSPDSGSSTPVSSAPEIVSRSGRKIKPKRFADDEIGSPATTLQKAGMKASQDEGTSTPPVSKRAKRKSSTASAAAPAEESVSPSVAAAVIPNAVAETEPKEVKKTPVAKQKQKGKGETKKSVTPASSVPTRKQQTRVSTETPKARVSPETVEAKKPAEENVLDTVEPEDDLKIDTNGDLNSVTETEQNEVNDVKPDKQEISQPTGKSTRVRLGICKDVSVEMVHDHDRPDFLTQDARIEWDLMTAKNLSKMQETMETTDPATSELMNLLATMVEQKEADLLEADEKAARDYRNHRLAILRMEGEVIEIIGDIINSLTSKSADCDRTLELLDRLSNHELSPLTLKKNPEVVEIVRKLQRYGGNAAEWGLSDNEKADFDEKSYAIRERARNLYCTFKKIFGLQPDSKEFPRIYTRELQKFRKYCENLSAQDRLNIADEPGDSTTKFSLKTVQASA